MQAGISSGSSAGQTFRLVSPVYQYARRDVVIVETASGRQAWYRSSGQNSGRSGTWFPFDEITDNSLHADWFNKWDYTARFPEGDPLHRFGSAENALISRRLGATDIPTPGAEVRSGEHLNALLDFFQAKRTGTYHAKTSRPTPDFR